jgi:hypothetical protein
VRVSLVAHCNYIFRLMFLFGGGGEMVICALNLTDRNGGEKD